MWASKCTMSNGASVDSPRTTGNVMAWSPPTTTGNAPRCTIVSTAAVSFLKFSSTSAGTTVTLPQSAMVTPASSSVPRSLSK
jgi:hypothetical protein